MQMMRISLVPQDKVTEVLIAKNYSLQCRNRKLVYFNRAMFLLNVILLVYIFLSVVVG